LHDISPDGKTLLAERWGGKDRTIVSATLGQNDWRPLFDSKAQIRRGQFSPDGRWVAYDSNESGRAEVYVADFPAARHKQRISTAGGSDARWPRGSHELFYLTSDGTVMAVAIGTGATISPGTPSPVLKIIPSATDGFRYAVSNDGRRFLVINASIGQASRDLSVVFNWPQLIK
jgi:hypothetical protein